MKRVVQYQGSSGLAIVAEEQGPADGPTVLLLHGGGQNRLAWKGSAETLASRGYRVVAVDARGHGDSEWDPNGDYEMPTMGADLLAVMDQLGTERPAVVGASLGGITALEALHALGRSDIYSAVVLVDITPRVEMDGARRVVTFMAAHPEGFKSLSDAAIAIAEHNPHRPPPSDTKGLAKVLRQGGDGRWRWHWDPRFISNHATKMIENPEAWQAEREERAHRLHQAAGSLSAPLLLIRGLLSDLVSDDAVAELRSAAPAAQYVDVRDAGHMVAGDDNDAFTNAVIGFLGQHLDPAI